MSAARVRQGGSSVSAAGDRSAGQGPPLLRALRHPETLVDRIVLGMILVRPWERGGMRPPTPSSRASQLRVRPERGRSPASGPESDG